MPRINPTMAVLNPTLKDYLTDHQSRLDISNYTLCFDDAGHLDLREGSSTGTELERVRAAAQEPLIAMIYSCEDKQALLTMRDRLRLLDHTIIEPYNQTRTVWQRVFSSEPNEIRPFWSDKPTSDFNYWINERLGVLDSRE